MSSPRCGTSANAESTGRTFLFLSFCSANLFGDELGGLLAAMKFCRLLLAVGSNKLAIGEKQHVDLELESADRRKQWGKTCPAADFSTAS